MSAPTPTDEPIGAPGRAIPIEADALTVAYGRAPAVVREVSLRVAAGSSTVLLGPSGCGKTTLLRSIAGLERPTSGTVRLGDRTVSSAETWIPPEARNVGMVFQDAALFPHLTVAQNVAFGLRRTGDRNARDRRVAELLELIGLEEFAARLPGTLSGGQQQRVALARSLAPNPAVLLLDEPFSALDAALRTQLRRDVRRIVREVGVTTVFVTHDQDEAFVMGDTIGVMHEGSLRQVGTPQELYARPVDRWVAEFVGEANIITGDAHDGYATTVLGRLPMIAGAPSGAVEVLLRPEELRISEAGVSGTVEHVDFFGHDARVVVGLATGERLVVRIPPRLGLSPGATVGLEFAGHEAAAWAAR